MAKQNWLRHICDKIPKSQDFWISNLIIKAPNQSPIDGRLYGKISWKIFKFSVSNGVFNLPDNDGEELNPPICPFCKVSLIEEEP